MSYSTPHHIRDYVLGSCLAINHSYCLQRSRRSESDHRKILKSTREIDLCARLGTFFESAARLHAQGSNEPDVQTDSPPFQIEVKYIFPKRTNWQEVRADWDWLLAFANTNENFRRRALVWFWPSTRLYKFTTCLSVSRSGGTQFHHTDTAPFHPYTTVEMPPHGNNQRLAFDEPSNQGPYALRLPGGKRVRLDLVGSTHHLLWCAVYTRLTPDEFNAINGAQRVTIPTGAVVLDG